ncbi:hypothetical protein BT69DRAFT_1257094 [Atractiella rhizophila]|nr:hypothetical protein BT69DRAFT_1257094 [Atractiella rhizophila]
MAIDVAALESFLADKSYIEGFQPSQADVAVFKALGSAPKTQNALRWYNHIASYESEFGSFPGDSKKSGESYIPSSSAAPAAAAEGGDDDDMDFFGSDDEEVDEEAEALKKKRLEEYAAKKAGKVKPVAKSLVTLDVKPWDDETPMDKLEAAVRSVQKDGLVWGLSKLVPVGYGVSKLQISLVVEDEKVSLDELQEQIAEFEDYVQSSDIQAMQKI